MLGSSQSGPSPKMRFLESRENGRAERQADSPTGGLTRQHGCGGCCARLRGSAAGSRFAVGTVALVAWWLNRPELDVDRGGSAPGDAEQRADGCAPGGVAHPAGPACAQQRRGSPERSAPASPVRSPGLTLLEWIFDLDLGIDRILLTPKEVSVREYAGRPSAEVATAFAAVTVALVTINHKISRVFAPPRSSRFFQDLFR